MRVVMQLINRFNCSICLWGEVKVFKIDEYEENVEGDKRIKYCMNAIYQATCNCVIMKDLDKERFMLGLDEEGQDKKVAKDVHDSIGW